MRRRPPMLVSRRSKQQTGTERRPRRPPKKGIHRARSSALRSRRCPLRRKPGTHHRRSDGRDYSDVRDVHLRIGSLAVSRPEPSQRAGAHGPRVLRHRRGGGPGRHVHQTRSVRDRIVCRLGQHVPALSRRVSLVVRAPRVDHGCAGAAAARADGGRHACRDDRGASGGPRPQLSGSFRRTRHWLVCR